MNPAIFSVLEEVLPRFGIDRLRFTRERFWPSMLGADFLPVVKQLNPAKWALIRWRSSQITPHLAVNDELFGVLYSGAVSKTALLTVLATVGLDQSVEICIHPGFPAPNDVQYYPRPIYNDFISSLTRKQEHDVLVDENVQAAVRRRGLTLRAFSGEPKH